MLTVTVTADDIRDGESWDCYRCPVALALQRATGDPEASVDEGDFTVRLTVWGLSVVAPEAVRLFSWAVDGGGDGWRDGVEPFAFKIPEPGSPEWQAQCAGCGDWIAPERLDQDGYCEDCRTRRE